MADWTWPLYRCKTCGQEEQAIRSGKSGNLNCKPGFTHLLEQVSVVEESRLREAEARHAEARRLLRIALEEGQKVQDRAERLEVELERARAYGLKQRERAQRAENELFRVRTRLPRP